MHTTGLPAERPRRITAVQFPESAIEDYRMYRRPCQTEKGGRYCRPPCVHTAFCCPITEQATPEFRFSQTLLSARCIPGISSHRADLRTSFLPWIHHTRTRILCISTYDPPFYLSLKKNVHWLSLLQRSYRSGNHELPSIS